MLIPLTGGAYTARDLISDAQRCVNLYPERNFPANNPPVPVTHYPTPGLKLLASPPASGAGRGLYVDVSGKLWATVGQTVYKVDNDWTFTSVGTLNASLTTPVSMADNETTVMLVDGSTNGYTWDVETGDNFDGITSANFYGSTRVDFLNTYFLLNKPGTPQFYVSLSNQVDFSGLYFANLTGTSTDLQSAVAVHGVVWLIGKTGSEIWFNSGDTNTLPFQRMPDQVLHQGCPAPYSIARASGDDDSQTSVLWLAESKDGNTIVVQGHGYAINRVSTHAIENAILNYPTHTDAVGFCYQQEGHTFYVLNFPSADVTWVYDLTTGLWHQRTWLDPDTGNQHRHRAQCAAYAYGKNVCLDWQDGTLYEFDLNTYVDQRPTQDGPIVRTRSFPHLINGLNRVIYARFIADIDAGNIDTANQPMMSLRWSDDRGHSYGNPIMQSMGNTGQYNSNLMWTRLGMARDRVFELSWSSPTNTALNGAYVEPIPLAT